MPSMTSNHDSFESFKSAVFATCAPYLILLLIKAAKLKRFTQTLLCTGFAGYHINRPIADATLMTAVQTAVTAV